MADRAAKAETLWPFYYKNGHFRLKHLIKEVSNLGRRNGKMV